VAERLAGAGHRVWLVGGAVRDLALGRQPKDLDLASAAVPEEVERLFDRTVSVGREFGTVLVLAGGRELQHTTFRSESGYADRRHPDRVAYGSSLEGDARRRDFTCNALYLDPLADEFRDPEGGLEDLRAGRLCAVGDAAERFREDGLRLIRMARFAARLDLEPAPELVAAARAEAGALEGVSPERTLGELERIFSGPRSMWLSGSAATDACPACESCRRRHRPGAPRTTPWPAPTARSP
jgi:tRNA nucleotidyltransferase/poly(A) polymerase